jgi:hypothetical protein
VNVPLLVPLVRLTNLQLPLDEKLDYAYADFYIQSRQMVFNELSIFSKSAVAYGFGIATLPDLKLNMKFQTRSRSRIPLVTGVFEFLRNELATVVVTGTPGDPKMTVAPLSGTTKALGHIFQGTPTSEQRMMDQLERRVEQEPRRPLRGKGEVEPRE